MIIPTDELIFFRGGDTTNQIGANEEYIGNAYEINRRRIPHFPVFAMFLKPAPFVVKISVQKSQEHTYCLETVDCHLFPRKKRTGVTYILPIHHTEIELPSGNQ